MCMGGLLTDVRGNRNKACEIKHLMRYRVITGLIEAIRLGVLNMTDFL